MVLLIKLVVFDLDNVIIDGEAIDEIGKLANVEEDIAEITEKYARWNWLWNFY